MPDETIAVNRRARHDYAIEDTLEAGLVLAEGLAHALIPPARARARRPATPTERPSALRLPDFGLALAHPGRGPPRRSA